MRLVGAPSSRSQFQPTRPRGARLAGRLALLLRRVVSTHAPTRSATPRRGEPSMRLVAFQPTRPRGARLKERQRGLEHARVSTHAPTRSATEFWTLHQRSSQVSTHAPTRSATLPYLRAMARVFWFQPTRPRGARRWASTRVRKVHAFQPTRHAERDTASRPFLVETSGTFQPTRPRGARPAPPSRA